jgi:aconitase B
MFISEEEKPGGRAGTKAGQYQVELKACTMVELPGALCMLVCGNFARVSDGLHAVASSSRKEE